MWTIAKRFEFSASHQLSHLKAKHPKHPCARLHGHNYSVEVKLRGHTLDERGFIYDYNDLEPMKAYIDKTLDHRHLNEVFESSHATTAENLAAHLFGVVRDLLGEEHGHLLYAVRVSETPKTWAEYRVYV